MKIVGLSICSNDFHLYSWLNAYRSNALNSFGRIVRVNDFHLEMLPCLRCFATSFSYSDSQSLVGIRTSPFFALLVRSVHTFSRNFTSLMVMVILTQWPTTSGSTGLSSVLKTMTALWLQHDFLTNLFLSKMDQWWARSWPQCLLHRGRIPPL